MARRTRAACAGARREWVEHDGARCKLRTRAWRRAEGELAGRWHGIARWRRRRRRCCYANSRGGGAIVRTQAARRHDRWYGRACVHVLLILIVAARGAERTDGHGGWAGLERLSGGHRWRRECRGWRRGARLHGYVGRRRVGRRGWWPVEDGGGSGKLLGWLLG
jgi:hypothetical protein